MHLAGLSIAFIFFFFDKSIRTSTFLLSIPLLLIVLLSIARSLSNLKFGKHSLYWLSVSLFLLAGIDMWAFVYACTLSGLLLSVFTIAHLAKKSSAISSFKNLRWLLFTLIISLIVFVIPTLNISHDASTRAGFGDDFKQPFLNYFNFLFNTYYESIVLILLSLGSLALLTSVFKPMLLKLIQ